MYVPRPAEKDVMKRLEHVEKTNRQATIQATVAFAAAVIFMGLQFWPTDYTEIMRKSMGALFLLTGLYLMFSMLIANQTGLFFRILKWAITVMAGLGVIVSIINYIISALSTLPE